MRQMGTEMGRSIHPTGATSGERVDWVDYAKGFCIVFVVMMHSTLGVENAVGQEGWMHTVVAFAKPFRMPDFFMISGLFLAQVIDRDWRTYLDRKVVHFVYFYLLWTVIDEFASRFVFFYTGYIAAPHIFRLAERAQASTETALAGLAVWGLVNGLLVFNGLGDAMGVSLTLGLAGAAAVCAL